MVFPGGSDERICLQWQETWVRSLGLEDPERNGYSLQYSGPGNPWTGGDWQATSVESQKSWTLLHDKKPEFETSPIAGRVVTVRVQVSLHPFELSGFRKGLAAAIRMLLIS